MPSASFLQTQNSTDTTQGVAAWAQNESNETTIEQLINQVGITQTKATVSLANAFAEMPSSVRF